MFGVSRDIAKVLISKGFADCDVAQVSGDLKEKFASTWVAYEKAQKQRIFRERIRVGIQRFFSVFQRKF
jgi:hypothetical protein